MKNIIFIIILGTIADEYPEAVFDNEEDLKEYIDKLKKNEEFRIDCKYINPKYGSITEPDNEIIDAINKKYSKLSFTV